MSIKPEGWSATAIGTVNWYGMSQRRGQSVVGKKKKKKKKASSRGDHNGENSGHDWKSHQSARAPAGPRSQQVNEPPSEALIAMSVGSSLSSSSGLLSRANWPNSAPQPERRNVGPGVTPSLRAGYTADTGELYRTGGWCCAGLSSRVC